ncbi:MAG: ATP-binding protein [Microbacteriaceae bacterium]
MRARARAPWTLRRRLVLGTVSIFALLSVVVGVVSAFAVNAALMAKLDQQLTDAVQQVQVFTGDRAEPSDEATAAPTDTATSGAEDDSSAGDQAGDSTGDAASDDSTTGDSTTGDSTEPAQQPGSDRGFLGAGLGPGAVSATIVDGEVSGSIASQSLENPGSDRDPQLSTEALTEAEAEALADVAVTGRPVTIVLDDLGAYRVVAVEGTDRTIILGLPLSEVTTTVTQVVVVIAAVVGLGVAIAVIAGLLVIRTALKPLGRVTETASRVSELPLERGGVALETRVPETEADPRTEVGRVGAALNRMLGHIAGALALRDASEAKLRTFVADASHELRTPLASIRGYAELTRRGRHQLPDDVVHALGRIESESVRMTSLVEDLLLLARLDDGRELERLPIELAGLLADAVSDAHAASQDHDWVLDVPDRPVLVPGDAPRLHQVVVNLLANARVHTPAGTRVVCALAVEGDRAVVTVTDSGPGIDPAVLPTIFERFARGDSSRARATGSTGLGLAIVHAVVTAHDGEVSVASEPGRTVFSVRLPLAPE